MSSSRCFENMPRDMLGKAGLMESILLTLLKIISSSEGANNGRMHGPELYGRGVDCFEPSQECTPCIGWYFLVLY